MAINLLPQQEKKNVRKLYRARRVQASSWFVVALVVVSIAMLLPMYFFAENVAILAQQKNAQMRNENRGVQADEVADEVNLINKKIQALSSTEHASVYKHISNITEGKLEGISIESIAFQSGLEKEEIRVLGKATNRDVLLAFRRDLEQKEYSEAVDLPVSNFAQNVNIDFSINIILKSNE